MRKVGNPDLRKKFEQIEPDTKSVNLLCDSGAVLGPKWVHRMVSNLADRPESFRLEAYESTIYDYLNYEVVLGKTVASLLDNELEICSVTCDNFVAQVRVPEA
jgi:hypothetical protein